MDLLFTRYASPFVLLDGYISTCHLVEFLDKFEEFKNESLEWEFFIHKLSALDERTWDEFQRDIHHGRPNVKKAERLSDEQIETTIKDSFSIMQNFEIEEGGES